MRVRKALAGATVALVALFGVAGCTGHSSVTSKAINADKAVSGQILSKYEQAQPVPQFDWSQIRQTAIDIETAQAHSTQTTTFFFNLGVADPINSCPSVGFPVASTTQLTNPAQTANIYSGSTGVASATIPQIDPNGIYSGDSTGTYVLCVGGDGQTYGVYWEGYVYAVTGPAVWNAAKHEAQMTGASSFKFTTTSQH